MNFLPLDPTQQQTVPTLLSLSRWLTTRMLLLHIVGADSRYCAYSLPKCQDRKVVVPSVKLSPADALLPFLFFLTQ